MSDERLEVNISNNQKLRIDSVRVNGDIVDADGNLVTQGAGIELSAEQVKSLGAANVQGLADVFFNQQ